MLERIVGIEICQKEILEKLNHLQNTLDHIRNIGQARPNTNEITDIIKSFPLKTQLSLNSLEDILSVNPIKRAALVAHLRLTGGTHLMNFIRNIMRSVFTDDCLSLFCWNGSDVKKSFQTLEIAKVIIESIETSKFLLVNRHDYIKVIRDFLDQARNRIKGRKRSDLLKQIEGRRSTV
ncbi:hypothetical protein M8J77_011884 [Diaphorina citri]|nr:hypothetical protein M8J77_011884 [Diaphorina citri]